MEELFFEIFQGLPREGPGDHSATKRAIDLLTDLPAIPRILDLGCGSGAQTMLLAQFLGGSIYALDKHQPYLDQLIRQAELSGFEESVQPVHADMHNLPFDPGFFDLVWAEGSIYILGFGEGLKYLKQFIKPDGYLALTEVSWLRNNQPPDLMAFWDQEYPGIRTIAQNLEMIGALGFTLVDHFILPPEAWWDNYYTPLENRLVQLRKKYLENDQAMELIEFVQLEIDIYRKYPDFYSYVFYIIRNS